MIQCRVVEMKFDGPEVVACFTSRQIKPGSYWLTVKNITLSTFQVVVGEASAVLKPDTEFVFKGVEIGDGMVQIEIFEGDLRESWGDYFEPNSRPTLTFTF